MEASDFASTTPTRAYTAGVQTPGPPNIHTSTYSSDIIITISRALHLQVPSVLYKDTDLSEVSRPQFQWLIGFRGKDPDLSVGLRPQLQRFGCLPCERSIEDMGLSAGLCPQLQPSAVFRALRLTGLSAKLRPKLLTG